MPATKVATSSRGRDRSSAIDFLRREHRDILRSLDRLETLAGELEANPDASTDEVQSLIEYFQDFVDGHHETLEEEYLFPVLETRHLTRAAGPIGALSREHKVTHALLAEMVRADRPRLPGILRDYANHVREHIRKEEDLLFPKAEKALTEEDHCSLCDRFASLPTRIQHQDCRPPLRSQ